MCEKPVKYFTEDENLKEKLVGVVVTIFQGSSYDQIFREVKPTTVPGERISTYSISFDMVEYLHECLLACASLRALTSSRRLPPLAVQQLRNCLVDGDWASVVEDIQSVPADGVVFNWECCSQCGDKAFPCRYVGCQSSGSRSTSSTMKLMGLAVRSGYTVMCSDFSLKSLIFEWCEEELGPNPFMQVGTCDGQFSLEFVPSELQCEEVPQQLQIVGELCADAGKAIVSAMSNTIVYTVDPRRRATDAYDLKVLTVVGEIASSSLRGSASDENMCCVGIGDSKKKGWAGHVTLTYAAGGQLVTSMGHWIEMSRIDTSLESVMRVAAKNFGAGEVTQFQTELATASNDIERSSVIQKRAREMVTKSQASRMKCRTDRKSVV